MTYYSYTGDGRQPAVLGVSILFFILTPVIVAVRFYSRVSSGVGLWWDDWTALFSLVWELEYAQCIKIHLYLALLTPK